METTPHKILRLAIESALASEEPTPILEENKEPEVE